jgi:hypothetical protein
MATFGKLGSASFSDNPEDVSEQSCALNSGLIAKHALVIADSIPWLLQEATCTSKEITSP